jgi:hypothetical protein
LLRDDMVPFKLLKLYNVYYTYIHRSHSIDTTPYEIDQGMYP